MSKGLPLSGRWSILSDQHTQTHLRKTKEYAEFVHLSDDLIRTALSTLAWLERLPDVGVDDAHFALQSGPHRSLCHFVWPKT